MSKEKPTPKERAALDGIELARAIIRLARKSIVTRRGNAMIDEYEKKYLKKG